MPASDLCRIGNDLRTSQRSAIWKIILHVDLLSILLCAFARHGVFFNIGGGRDAVCCTDQLDKELGDYKAPVSSASFGRFTFRLGSEDLDPGEDPTCSCVVIAGRGLSGRPPDCKD